MGRNLRLMTAARLCSGIILSVRLLVKKLFGFIEQVLLSVHKGAEVLAVFFGGSAQGFQFVFKRVAFRLKVFVLFRYAAAGVL